MTMVRRSVRCAGVGLTVTLALAAGPPPSASQGQAAAPGAAEALAHARDAMGFQRAAGRVLHAHAVTAAQQAYQSDRTYPPHFDAMTEEEIWFDPSTRVLRVQAATTAPGAGPDSPAATVDDGVNAEIIEGERRTPLARRQATTRGLNAWAVVADWSAAPGVTVAGVETYRDYPRDVLTRETPQGRQRLFVDRKSGFPVKLELVEPHYLWGQQRIEYIWSTWVLTAGVAFPGSAFRMADGEVDLSQTIGTLDLRTVASAPPLDAPRAPQEPPADLPIYLQPLAPATVKVTDRVSLVANRGYREAVALAGDQIYVFDATQGDARAMQDEQIVTSMFPGRHRVTVVVTDLAWPHVAGVRYWVSRGARIVSHTAARAFLQRVIDRRWTLAPDALEQRRSKERRAVPFDFVGIDRPTTLEGGVRVVPIDGIGSEVALMAYLPEAKLLWASDYIQTVDKPSLYAGEVLRAAERAGIEPDRAAAQHLRLTDWSTVRAAQQPR
jgi:hypothetical protein